MTPGLSNKSGIQRPSPRHRKNATVQDTSVDKAKFSIFLSVITILIVAIIAASYFMLSEDEDSDSKNTIGFECYKLHHKITSNGTAQFVFHLDNKAEDKNIITTEVLEKPENWTVYFDQSMTVMQNTDKKLRVLTVKAPKNITLKQYQLKIKSSSMSYLDSPEKKVSVTLDAITQDSNATVDANDEIAVNYIGYLSDGTIFDTSVESVAKNENAKKTEDFSVRQTYSTLDFKAGAGEMIQGFDEGVMGMSTHETNIIIAPPDKGYTSEGHDLYGKTLYFEVTMENIEKG